MASIARVTSPYGVVPALTTSSAVSTIAASRFASGSNATGGVLFDGVWIAGLRLHKLSEVRRGELHEPQIGRDLGSADRLLPHGVGLRGPRTVHVRRLRLALDWRAPGRVERPARGELDLGL